MIKTQHIRPLERLWKLNFCIGCGACLSICPEKIITIDKTDDENLYKPIIRKGFKNKCTGCGLCLRVCPFRSLFDDNKINHLSNNTNLLELEKWLIGPYHNIFTGHSLNSNHRYLSSSGGIASTLLAYLFKTNLIDGALVACPTQGNATKHKITLVKNSDEALENNGTVYTQIDYSDAWKAIRETKGRLAIVGLPCHLKAVDLFLSAHKLDTSRYFKIGLFCSGTSQYRVLDLLCKRKKISHSSILKLRYRSGGWPGKKMVATVSDSNHLNEHREIVLFDRDSSLLQKYLYNFCFSGSFFHKCCLVCRDHTAEYADISLGDAWLPRFTLTDTLGTNIVISRTINAQRVLESEGLKKDILLQKATAQDIINSQKGLVGKKIGILGNHLAPNFLYNEGLRHCTIHLPEFIPTNKVVLEKRIYRWIAKHLPNNYGYHCYVLLKIITGIYNRSIRIVKNI